MPNEHHQQCIVRHHRRPGRPWRRQPEYRQPADGRLYAPGRAADIALFRRWRAVGRQRRGSGRPDAFQRCLQKPADVARRVGTVVVLDLDYRPYGWTDSAQAAVYLRVACAMADIVIGNREEFDVLELLEAPSPRDDHASARKVLRGVTQVVVVKDGQNGCRVFHRDGSQWTQGIFAVQTRKPFGSGDAFAGTFLWALFNQQSWAEAIRLGAAAAAINVSRDGCAEVMATLDELNEFIAQHPNQK